MRFRSTILLVGVILVSASILLLAGCSGTDKSVPINNAVDYSEVWLPNATNQVNDQLDSVVARINTGLFAVTAEINDPSDLERGGLDGSVQAFDSSTYQAGWNVIFISNLQTSLGITSVLDSIQYSKNNITQQFNGNADAISFNHLYIRTAVDTTVTSSNVTMKSNFKAEGLDQSRTTVDGSVSAVIVNKTVTSESTIWHTWDIQTTASALRVDKVANGWGEGCPSSGTLNLSVTHTYQKGNDAPIETNWEFAAMFSNGVVTVNVSNNSEISNTYQQTICNP